MTAESLISKSGPCPLPFHSTCRPWCLGLHGGPALPPARGSRCPRARLSSKGFMCVSWKGFSALCSLGEHYTLQTPQAGFVCPGISSNISADGFKQFSGPQVCTDSDFSPFIFQSFPKIPPIHLCNFCTNAYPCATLPLSLIHI